MGKQNALTVKLGLTGLALLVIIMGLASFGIPAMSYMRPVLLATGALILLIELGVKKFTNLSSVTRFGATQWVAFAVAIILLISAVISLPFIAVSIAWITAVSGIVLLIGGLAILLEAWTKMNL